MRRSIAKLLKAKTGILLDLSLGGTPQPNAVVLSPDAAADVRHDPRQVPLPLPDGCVHTAIVTHVLEYLAPDEFFRWFDELHRVMRPHGVVYLSGPYGGDESQGWLSDPTHRVRVTEQAFAWLDPRTPLYEAHAMLGRARPKPWHPQQITRVPGTYGAVGYNAILQAVPNGHV